MITEDDCTLFRQIRQIANIVYEYATPNQKKNNDIPWLQDRRNESVNPFYNQTSSGLFLELYYGQPGFLHTPWGKWNCWGSGSSTGGDWEERLPLILKRLGAIEYLPEIQTQMGCFGPVYKLTSLDGITLPEAIVRNPEEYLPYEEANAIWKELELRIVPHIFILRSLRFNISNFKWKIKRFLKRLF